MKYSVITITNGQHGWTVQRNNNEFWADMSWDEMLGTVAELTHPNIGKGHYRVMSLEEYTKWRELYAQ